MGQSMPCYKGVQKATCKSEAGVLHKEKCEPKSDDSRTTAPKSDDSSSHDDQPAPIAELGPDGLPSVGSALHFSSECKRCAFFSKGRCQKGHACQFCHFDHDAGKRTKKKRARDGSDAERPAPVLSTEAPQAGIAVPAQVSGNPLTLDDLLRNPEAQTTILDAHQYYWSQQQWGGPVQQWPGAEQFHSNEYMQPYVDTADYSVASLYQYAGVEKDFARTHILAMVGAWDALTAPMEVPTSIAHQDFGVDAPPLTRDDLLRFRQAAIEATVAPQVPQEQHGIRAVKDLGENSSPVQTPTRNGVRSRNRHAAASAA